MIRYRIINHKVDRRMVDFLVVEYISDIFKYYWIKQGNIIDVTLRFNHAKRIVGIGAVKYEEVIMDVLDRFLNEYDNTDMTNSFTVIKGGIE